MTSSNYQTTNKQWSERWFAMLHGFGLYNVAGRDKPLTKGSRITRLEVLVGAISAEVQDRAHGVCTVLIQVTPWDEATWTRVLDTLGSQPFFVTQALAGNLPAELEQTLQQLDAPLLPTRANELTQSCSCKHTGKSLCPELLAVHQQFGEMLNDEPWLLLRLRGRDRQQILQTLQARRSGSNGAPSTANASTTTAHREPESYVHRSGNDSAATAETAALTDEIAHFWGSRRQLEAFHHHIMPPSIELVLLRRLGAPTSTAEGGVAYEQLSRIYRKVTAEALALAYAPETNEETVE